MRALRILVLDDKQSNLDILANILVQDKHEVLTFLNGEHALIMLEHESFDLVITDNYMPVMSGEVFTSLVKQKSPKTPVIMITGHLKETSAPVDLILNKPFTIDELRDAISSIV